MLTKETRSRSERLRYLAEVLGDVGYVFGSDIGVVRKIEAEIMHLVSHRQMSDAILLDPEGLTAHRAAYQRTTLDALREEMPRHIETVLGVSTEGET